MKNNQLNEDNIISAVARVALKTQESPKTGNVILLLLCISKTVLKSVIS